MSFKSILSSLAIFFAFNATVSQARDPNVPEYGYQSVTFTTLYAPKLLSNTSVQYGGAVYVQGFWNRDGKWIPSHWKTVRVIENNYYRSNCLDAANRVRSSYNQNDRFNIKGYGSVVGPSVDAVYVLSDNVVCSIRQF
jgi:hypothetical protein